MMKWLRLVSLFLLLGGSYSVESAPPAGYYLVWADEFNGSSLDSTKWDYWLAGARRDAVNVSSAVAVGGGYLTITTYTTNGTHYTGMIATDGKFRTKFGYWEASIDWNDSPGMWSAYWMQSPTMGADLSDPVTSGNEIDLAEHRLMDSVSNNIANQVQVNIHWNGYGASTQGQGSGNVGSSLNNGFHTYGFQWTASSYNFSIDGASKWTGGSSPVSHSTEWMILSSEVQDGSWAGNIPSGGYGSLVTSTTKMTVDYVRYYAPTNALFWKGATSAYWTNAANWVSNLPPATTSDLTFSYLSTANLAGSLGANLAINSLTVLETTSAFAVSGTNTLTLGSGGVDMISLSKDAAFNCPVVMGAAQTWAIGANRKLTLNNNLSGTGVLTKAGAGTLVVGVSNTIAKSIFATAGTIGLSAGCSNQYNFSASANGAVTAFVGASPARCSALNLTNADLNFSFGTVSGTPGVGVVVPALNVSGTVNVNVTGQNLPLASITLLTYTTKAGGGTIALGTLPAGAAATLTDTGSALILNVTSWPQVLTWDGATSGTWNTNGTLDWNSVAGAVAAYHEYASNADSVVFDDTATDFSVTLSSALRPASVSVDNDTNAYSFSAPGKITGTTGLVKTGTNSLTLNTLNDFTGNMTVSDGTVAVSGSGGLYQYVNGNNITVKNNGTLSLTGDIGWQSKALGWLAVQASGIVLDGGTWQHTGTGNAASSSGAGHLFTIGANGATLDSATAGQTFSIGYRYDYSSSLTSSSGGSLELTGAGNGDLNYIFPGTGNLLKTGTGTWSLTAPNTFTGSTTVSAGVLNIRTNSALGSSAGGVTVANNARLELQGNLTISGEALNLSGPGGAAFYDGALNSKSGSNVWTGNLTLAAVNTRIGCESGATLLVSGVIDDGAETNSLTVRSADATGTVILSGANTYQGSTLVVAGNLQLAGGNNRLPIGTTLILGGVGNVTFDLNGRSQEVAGLTTNAGTTCVVTNSSGTAATFTVNTPAGSPSTYAGRMAGNLALTKSGLDTLTLTSTNNYIGATLISGGTLAVNGFLGTNAVTVAAAGTLAGTGIINGAVTVQSGGTLSPGAGAPGRMVISNSLTLQSGSTNFLKLNKTAGTNDNLLVSGLATYGGTLALTNLGGTLAGGDTFKLFSAATVAGNFSAVAGSPGTGLTWRFNPTNGVLTVYSTVPTNLVANFATNVLNFSWPADHRGWTLQVQTNALSQGLGTNWISLPASATTNRFTTTIGSTNGAVFYRLVFQ